jgi:hypothetical protein
MTKPEKTDNLERLLKAYVKMRDKRSQLKREFDEADGSLRKKMGLVEAELLKMLNAAGSDSLKVTGVGQAFLTKKVTVKATDWNALWNYILESKHIDLLQKRVASRAVQEFVDTEGEMPPGVDMHTERVVSVRRD